MEHSNIMRFLLIETPIGVIRLEGSAEAIERVRLPGEKIPGAAELPSLQPGEKFPALQNVAVWLKRYFDGDRSSWKAGKLPRCSNFTLSIYKELLKVPFGATVSYGELAKLTGSPGAARAVGRAMATNPLPILIPCHRVLSSDGSLHGYGGGLPMKKALLEHEGVLLK